METGKRVNRLSVKNKINTHTKSFPFDPSDTNEGMRMRASRPFRVIVTILIELLIVRVESVKLSSYHVKLNKCCPLNEYFNATLNHCVRLSEQLTSPNVFEIPSNFKKWNEIYDVDFNLSVSWKTIGFNSSKCLITTVQVNQSNNEDNEISFSRHGVLLTTLWSVDSHDLNHYHLSSVNYQIDEFCIDPVSDDELVIRSCPVECGKDKPCIRKCCPVGEHLVHQEGQLPVCVSSGKSENWTWDVPLYHSKKLPPLLTQPRFNSGHPACKSPKTFAGGWSIGKSVMNRPFILLDDGNILEKDYEGEVVKFINIQGIQDFCVDRLEAHPKHSICPGEEEALFWCPGKSANMSNFNESLISESKKDGWKITYDIFMVVALLLLFTTIIILMGLWEKQNIHSWTRLAYVISHFFFFFCVSLTHADCLPPLTSPGCKFYGTLLHFFALCTLCWLSVINFDLWWTFKVLKPTSDLRVNMCRFFQYACFAIGGPLIVISVAWIIQRMKPPLGICRKKSDKGPIYADYGLEDCSLSKEARGVYWYLPLCILLLANLIFFLATTCRMFSLQRLTRRASIENTGGGGSGSQSNKIFIKIFIVSGITWNFELLGWFLDKADGPWVLLDIAHHVHAICLFIIFVCKKDVLRNLQSKYPKIKEYFPFLHVTDNADDVAVIPSSVRFQRSATLAASMSTEVSSKTRIAMSRKLSTTSNVSINSLTTPVEKYQRHDSFDSIPLAPVDNEPIAVTTPTPMPLIT